VQFADARVLLKGCEANGAFRQAIGQESGFHGKKPRAPDEALIQARPTIVLAVRSFCTAEVYHSLR
jgi:hypothetical protein